MQENRIFCYVSLLAPFTSYLIKIDITPRLIVSTDKAGSFFAQRIGIPIQRGNAASIFATEITCTEIIKYKFVLYI